MRYILIALFLYSIAGFGQSESKTSEKEYNLWSIELGGGIHTPISPTKGLDLSKYVALRQFQVSGRYMFNQKYGLKAHYAFNGFRNPDANEMTLDYHRVGVEGVANLAQVFDIDYRIRERFILLAHAGVGITFANPYTTKGTDHLGHIIVGLKPQLKLSDKFALYGDVSGVVNFKQHYDYNGVLMHENYKAENGFFMNFSVGVIMNLGKKEFHADWY